MTQTIIETAPDKQQFKDIIEAIAAGGTPADARVIYRSRNVVSRLLTPKGEINIKQFRRPDPLNRYIYTTLRPSKAHRSFSFAARLRAAGINTPAPIAYIEHRQGGALTDSYYISEQIEAEELRQPELRTDEQALLEALGREMARLHRAGILMLDFSPGNILFNTDTNGGGYSFHYVDLNRTLFDEHSPARLMQMFRSIVVEPRQTAIIARAYARAAGLDEDLTVAEALHVHARFQSRLRRKRKIKRLLMPWKKKYRL